MFSELKKYIVEVEESEKNSQILIYQDNIDETLSEIDSINVELRSLMESKTIQDMIDDGSINEGNYDNANAGFSLIYKDLFAIREKMEEALNALTDLRTEIDGDDISSGSKIDEE